jgi:lysophospholipase L1-like esterase
LTSSQNQPEERGTNTKAAYQKLAREGLSPTEENKKKLEEEEKKKKEEEERKKREVQKKKQKVRKTQSDERADLAAEAVSNNENTETVPGEGVHKLLVIGDSLLDDSGKELKAGVTPNLALQEGGTRAVDMVVKLEKMDTEGGLEDYRGEKIVLNGGVNDINRNCFMYMKGTSKIKMSPNDKEHKEYQDYVFNEIINAYERIYKVAGNYNIAVFQNTLLPFGSTTGNYLAPTGRPDIADANNKIRERINLELIAREGKANGPHKLIQIHLRESEGGLADNDDPTKIHKEYAMGDNLHVEGKGVTRMAEIMQGVLGQPVEEKTVRETQSGKRADLTTEAASDKEKKDKPEASPPSTPTSAPPTTTTPPGEEAEPSITSKLGDKIKVYFTDLVEKVKGFFEKITGWFGKKKVEETEDKKTKENDTTAATPNATSGQGQNPSPDNTEQTSSPTSASSPPEKNMDERKDNVDLTPPKPDPNNKFTVGVNSPEIKEISNKVPNDLTDELKQFALNNNSTISLSETMQFVGSSDLKKVEVYKKAVRNKRMGCLIAPKDFSGRHYKGLRPKSTQQVARKMAHIVLRHLRKGSIPFFHAIRVTLNGKNMYFTTAWHPPNVHPGVEVWPQRPGSQESLPVTKEPPINVA